MRLADYERGDRALAEARRLLRDDPAESARLMLRQAAVQYRRARFGHAVRWVRRGLRTIEHDSDGPAQRQRAHLEAYYAAIRFRQGRLREAIDWCRRAIDDATVVDARDALAHAYYMLDYALVALGRQDEAIYSERALAIYQELGDVSEEAGVLNNLGAFAYYDGRWRDAVDYYHRAEDAFERAGDRWLATMATTNRGELLSDQGRLDEAEQLFKYALRVARAAGSASRIADINGFYGRLAARAGRFDEAREVLGERARAVRRARRARRRAAHGRAAGGVPRAGRACRRGAGGMRCRTRDRGSLEGVYTIIPYLLRIRGWALLTLGQGRRGAAGPARPALGQANDKKADYEIALTADVLAQVLRADGERGGGCRARAGARLDLRRAGDLRARGRDASSHPSAPRRRRLDTTDP